jgi:hypothetical protein
MTCCKRTAAFRAWLAAESRSHSMLLFPDENDHDSLATARWPEAEAALQVEDEILITRDSRIEVCRVRKIMQPF